MSESLLLDLDLPVQHYHYSPDIVRSFVQHFYQDNHDLAEKILSLYQAGQYDQVAYRLHKLLPVVRMFHFHDLAKDIQHLETQVRTGSFTTEQFSQIASELRHKIEIFIATGKKIASSSF